nr:protein cornichon homolog 4-like [Ipomoea batatas]
MTPSLPAKHAAMHGGRPVCDHTNSEMVWKHGGGVMDAPAATYGGERAQKLTKVLLNVSFQNSLGPLRVVLSPENTVGDLITAAVEMYVKEKRRPLLPAAHPGHYELHYSQFSLQSLREEEKLINSKNNKRSGRLDPRFPAPDFRCRCRRYPMPSPTMADVWAWMIFFFMLVALIVMVVFQLMCLADLEFDYINPYDSASRINKVILPEFITHGVLCFLYLVTGHWIAALICVPYLYYNVRLYLERQHLIDVTEIFNQLNYEKKRRLWKLAYLVLLLFMSLFMLIYSALEDDDEHSQ